MTPAVMIPTVFEQREHPAVIGVGSCCNRAVRLLELELGQTPTIVVYHPPTIVAMAVNFPYTIIESIMPIL